MRQIRTSASPSESEAALANEPADANIITVDPPFSGKAGRIAATNRIG